MSVPNTPAAKKVATVLLLIALSLVASLALVRTFPAALAAAQAIGLPQYAAVSWALLPDAGTLVGLLGALVLTDRRGRHFAIVSVVLFGLSSALVNVAHALSGRYGEEPVALLVAYGLTATLALVLSAETASRVVVSLAPAVEAKPVPHVEKKVPADKAARPRGRPFPRVVPKLSSSSRRRSLPRPTRAPVGSSPSQPCRRIYGCRGFVLPEFTPR